VERTFRITVNGREYHVTVEELGGQGHVQAAAAIVAPAAGGSVQISSPAVRAAAGAGSPGDVTAPMPGVVASVEVAPGQTVSAGQRVVVLDAMKMNMPVVAPRSGTVTRVLVKQGDTVEGGQPLVTVV
jgi:biotin carboxyl carrier protein